nr:transposase [Streptomyces atroolivaceus]
MLGRQFPKVKAMLLAAETDLTAFAERIWKKTGDQAPRRRRPDLPHPNALERLNTAVLIEMYDEWIAFPHSCLPNGGTDSVYPTTEDPRRGYTATRTGLTMHDLGTAELEGFLREHCLVRSTLGRQRLKFAPKAHRPDRERHFGDFLE